METGQAKSRITFSGMVKHVNGNSITNLKVILSEQKLREKKQFAETVTDANGKYSFTIKALAERAVYLIEATDDSGKSLASSAAVFQPEQSTVINLTVKDARFKGIPSFELRKQVLEKYFEELNKGDEKKPLSVDDVYFISKQIDLKPQETFYWIRAKELEAETKITAELFYGLFKLGLPTNTKALSVKDGKTMKEAIKKAVEENYVSDKLAADADSIIERWNNYIIGRALNEVPEKMDTSLGKILSMAIRSKAMQKKVLNAYLIHEGTAQEFWDSLHEITKDKTSSKKIQTALQLGVLTGNQPDMMQALMNENLKREDFFRELAGKNRDEWVTYVTDLSKKKKKSAVPVFIEGKDENERVKKYAGRISKILEKSFPTHSFFGKLAKQKPEESAFASSYYDMITFFGNNPSFDIKNTPTISLLEEDSSFSFKGISDKRSMVAELQSVQRLMSYTTDFKAASQLKDAGMDSAGKIVSVPHSTFIKTYTPVFGSVEEAEVVFKKAEKNYMHSAMLWTAIHPSLNLGTTVASQAISEPTLRTIFGTLDVCECEHCASVYSPAAYYTDILKFLYKRASKTYDELIRRRPDLVHLELSCKNTNTALPYVDLVNELLENFILSHKSPAVAVDYYQTTWEQNELAANPEHLDKKAYEAYNELLAAVYPHLLPFNLPVEEARVYLKHLSIQRHQLMTIFFAGTEDEAFDDFDICMERLNISLQEGEILSGVAKGNGTANSGLWNFYGFDKSNGYKPLTDPADSSKQISGGLWSVALTGRVDVFLQQTELKYKDMLTMLLCDFINPVTGVDSYGNDVRAISMETNCDCSEETCELAKLELTGVTSTHLRKIHRFLRLWRKLGWSMFDLDKAIKAFGLTFGSDTEKNKIALRKISQAIFLSKQLNLSLDETLSLWSDIGTTSYVDYFKDGYPPILSMYDKLFINKAVLSPVDAAFKDLAALTGSMDDHTATIFAALQISDADYGYLTADTTVVANNNLTLANLSSIHRHALLARNLKLSVKDFLLLKKLIGTPADIFNSPLATFQFLLRADIVKTSGFSVDQLNYILFHDYLKETEVAPDDDTISVFLSELRSSLRTIETSTAREKSNTVVQKFSEELKITTTAAGLLLTEYLKGIINITGDMVEDFLADDFSTSNFLKTYTDNTDPSNPVDFEPVFVRENPDSNPVWDAEPKLFDDYMKMEKIASVINKLKLSDDDLEYILDESAKLKCTNLIDLPVAATTGDFKKFGTLVNLIKARDAMPVGTPDFFDIIDEVLTSDDKDAWLEDLCTRTNWDRTKLESLVGDRSTTTDAGLLKTKFPDDFVNGDLILRVKACMSALKKIGLNPALINSAIQTDLDSSVSTTIKNAAKAKYDENQWLKLAKPLRDDLREKQREALVAYVIAHACYDTTSGKYERWKNSDELYEYLLIDVEMKPISMTSRIKQAICSVQLFIDRVLMNLEHPNSDPSIPALSLDGDQVEEWKEWRMLYRIWEANRKIFLHPENWLEPELRDDKSPFFKELEAQLKQNELTDENVEDAFYVYLEKLDDVARLEVIGFYHQVETGIPDEANMDILHVFGRSYSDPPKYYHRTLDYGEWTSWNRLEIDVDGNHIIPVIFNRKLCLFWLFFTQEKEEQSSINAGSSVPASKIWWKIQAAWSELKNNKWTAKKLSKSYIESIQTDSQAGLEAIKKLLYLETVIVNDNLVIRVAGGYIEDNDGFIFNDTNTDPIAGYAVDYGYVYSNPYVRTYVENAYWSKQMVTAFNQDYKFEILTEYDDKDGYYIVRTDKLLILETTKENKFKLVLPSNERNPYYRYFFFQDAKNTFYINHKTVISIGFTKPDFGINDWVTGVVQNWGDMFTYIHPADHNDHIDPTINIDRYFQSALMNTESASDKGQKIQRSEIKQFPAGMIEGNPVSDYTTDALTRPKMLYDRKKAAAASGRANLSHDFSYKEAQSGLLDSAAFLGIRYYESDQFVFSTFYHAHVKTFLKYLIKSGVDGLLVRDVETQADTILFEDSYAPTSLVPAPYPTNEIDFEYGGAYSQYNWELFFHVPMLVACRLKDDQRFEEARDWFHYIFNPTNSEGGGKERFWQFRKFYDEAGTEIKTLEDLLKNETELAKQIEKWMDDPFEPHVIARMRISAYMKNVVMKYLDNLIAWGDNLFKRDTIESINEATNLYILASKILGERPQDIPPRTRHDDAVFDDIKNKLDSFSNAMVNIETMISPSATPSSMTSSDTPGALGEMFFFCVPRNEYLLKYWNTVADRLFKIRNSMNIEGVVRTLPLFEPPIDPAMLVRAAAAGMDLSSILSDVNAALPNYRFSFMLQKANEFTNEVKSLGSALLQALETRDGEALSLLRSTHEGKLLSAVLTLKEKQADDAKESLDSVKKSLELARIKYEYYMSRPFMNDFEKQHLNSIQLGMILSRVQGELNTIGGVLCAIPNFKLGSPYSIGATWGGHNLGSMMSAISTYIGVIAAINSSQGVMASTIGGYTRRMDDWQFQSDLAKKEISRLEKQILSAEIKLAIAEKDLLNQKLQIENNKEMDEFMRNKFTSKQLYDWMIGQISTVYFQSYQLAYDLAKKAEQCYQYELGNYDDTSFIQFGYWDSLKKGLLSAEKLQYDLRRMETSFYDNNKRELELTKNISLVLLYPQAVLDLRSTGKCTFIIPEALFDLDFPGHYFRRIKSVSLSIPCITGPYTSVCATLRLKTHTTRLSVTSETSSNYGSANYAGDDRFRHVTAETHSIATSNAQNDSGVFELNFRDERYLPFEGCGAFGEWELELNDEEELRLFDYNTISDIVITLRYTALEDEPLKDEVQKYLKDLIKSTLVPTNKSGGIQLFRMFSLRNEFTGEWQKMLHPPDGKTFEGSFGISQERFPYFTQSRTIVFNKIYAYGLFNNSDDYTVKISKKSATVSIDLNAAARYEGSNTVSLPSAFKVGEFTVSIKKGNSNITEDEINDLVLVFEYQLSD
jgi:hypothetical protein